MGPNGAGKSTLIEAVSWALYGNKSEIIRTGREGIKRAGAGPNDDCTVLLVFELGGVQYQLKRSMRGKDLKAEAELLADGGIMASSERTVTQKVEEILGMDYRAFFISVFARQKDLSALSVLSPAERKKLIMRMLELDVLQDVLDGIKKDGREERTALQFVSEQLLTPDRRPKKEVLAEELGQLEAQVAQFRKDLDDANGTVQAKLEELEKARGQKDWVALKEEDFRKAEKRVLEKRKEHEEAQRGAALAAKDLQALRDRLAALPDLEMKEREHEALVKRKEEMESNLARFEERRAAAANLNLIRDEARRTEESLARTREEIAKLKNPQESLNAVTANLEALEKDSGEKRERAAWLDSEIKRLRRELDELGAKRVEVSRLGPESMCPTCERQLGEHHHYLLSKLEKDAEQKSAAAKQLTEEWVAKREELDLVSRRRTVLDDRRKKLQNEVAAEQRAAANAETYQERLASLQKELTAQQARLDAMGEVDFDQAEYNRVRSGIASLKPLAERCKVLRGEGARQPELEARRTEMERGLAARDAELKKAQADLAAVGYREGDLKQAQAAYDAAFAARESAYGEVSKRASALELANGRVEDKKAALQEVSELEKGIALRAKKVQQLAVLEKVMADFKQNVVDRVVPTLSEVSSQMFTEMTDSKYGGIELDEDYEMQIYDGGEKYPVGRFSGGEGDLANLSLRLAISRVLADRSGNDINFLILDEIFGSQDQVRKRNIMATLNRLEKQFHQIVLITHIDDTKDFMNYVITIKELDDGTSTVEV
jgi:exonuclease SbcC